MTEKSPSRNLQLVVRIVLPWIPFYAYLVWAWRVPDIFHRIPAYGDALEVLWGIEWWYDSVFVKHVSPLFTNLIFYPTGWHTATLAHTPTLFLLAQPLRAIGGVAFAYNVLVLLAQYVAFAGAFRFLRLYGSRFATTIAALMFSFWHMRWFRAGGHLNIFWATALLPWLAWQAHKIRSIEGVPPPEVRKSLWICGLLWGAMINFSLYSWFLGALVFLMWGKDLWSKAGVLRLLQILGVALCLGGPVTALYYLGAQRDGTVTFDAFHLLSWGASVNSLVAPSVYHPIAWIRAFARSIYRGPYDESGVANIGTVTIILAFTGLVAVLRKREIRQYTEVFFLLLGGGVLSLGLLMKWNGGVTNTCVFSHLNTFIWKIGHFLKPHLFVSPEPEGPFVCGLPLPALLLAAIVPFWESARVASRYAFIAILGILPLSIRGLRALPRSIKWLAVVCWLVEFLPHPTGNLPLPSQLHPAYVWVSQHISRGEAVVEVRYPTLQIGGSTLYAALLGQAPTASGVGSFWPRHTFDLWQYFLHTSDAWQNEETAAVLRVFRVRYVLVYIYGEKETALLEEIQQNHRLHFIGCFDPPSGPSPWPMPICVVEVSEMPDKPILLRTSGWSGKEAWGVWAEGTRSEASLWIPYQTDVRLLLEAFPHCAPGRQQTLVIKVNGVSIAEHQWGDCSSWNGEVVLPASLLHKGANHLEFIYAYAVRPVDITNGLNGDARWLSVGFVKLTVEEVEP